MTTPAIEQWGAPDGTNNFFIGIAVYLLILLIAGLHRLAQRKTPRPRRKML